MSLVWLISIMTPQFLYIKLCILNPITAPLILASYFPVYNTGYIGPSTSVYSTSCIDPFNLVYNTREKTPISLSIILAMHAPLSLPVTHISSLVYNARIYTLVELVI